MIHLGDITYLHGGTIPVVDIITGGSPCQDLSVAGKRAGLNGERSGLFMEQIRIVKEMRERDRRAGRTAWLIRPRFMVWENVPGAFSSSKGRDFQAVLTEIVKIAEPDAPDVPMPEGGRWNKAGCLYSGVGNWSIAWRVHDAQFWGVPQRRKRIALVADFGGLSAPEILFERKGLRGHFEPSEAQGQGTATATESGVRSASAVAWTYRGRDGGCNVEAQDELSYALRNPSGGGSQPNILQVGEPIPINTMVGTRDTAEMRTTMGVGDPGDPQFTISAAHAHAVFSPEPVPIEGNGQRESHRGNGYGNGGDPMFTLNSTEHHAVAAEAYGICSYDSNAMKSPNPHSGIYEAATARTLDLNGGSPACNQGGIAVVRIVDTYQETTGALCAGILKQVGNQIVSQDQLITKNAIVRRLTPLECERLQGFPDGWTDIGEWTDSKGRLHKEADSPRYKALGNSIALPFWEYLARRICAQYERPATMGSLFDGIGGFPLAFERAGAKAVWASEIEEFPIAVTKLHFPEERSIE